MKNRLKVLRLIEIKKASIATGFALAIAATWGLLALYTDVQNCRCS